MRLIYKSTGKRDVAQRHIGIKHVLSSQFDATPDHKGVRGAPECAPKSARKVRLAAPHQGAQICHKHTTGDMAVDVVEHFPCLPCQQTLFALIRGPFHWLWINLPSQQRGCLEYRAVRRLFLMKVTDGCIQERYYIVHPVTRSALTDIRIELRFAHLSLHCRETVSAFDKDVDRELQWGKAPSIEGLPLCNRRRHILCRMRTLHLLCAAICLIGDAAASPPPLDITEYERTSFSPAQGSPARAAVLAQTSDGFLWLGAASGLYRFDGIRFERIAAVGGVPLLGEFITALEATQSGGLWIGYQYGGASFLDGGGLKSYPPENGGLSIGTLEAFAIDPDGVVWAGSTRGLSRLDGQRWTDVSQTLGLPAPNAGQLMLDKSGDLWIGSGDKLALLRRRSSRVHVYDLLANGGFVRDTEGRVWNLVSTRSCLYLLDPTRDDLPPCRHLPPPYNDFWLIDRTGNLWVSDAANRLSVIPTPSLDRAVAPPAAQSKPKSEPRFLSFDDRAAPASALQDREGNVWFGTPGGLEQLRVPRLRRHGPFPEFVVLGAGNHNSLWVATTHFSPVPDDDFFQLQDGRMVPYRGGPTQITASYRDATGVLWVGGYGRLWKLNDRAWEEIAAPPRELANAGDDTLRRTQAIARDARGDLWLSVVRAGLFRLRDRQWERVSVPGILASDYPFVIYPDGDGSVWLGYFQERKRLEQRMEDRLNERTRIARELHDSLLQGFQGLMFRLQAVRQLLPGRVGDAAKSLDSALQLGDQAIVEGRDAVENLRATSFDNRDLATSLQTLGAELGVDIDSQPHYGLVVEGRPRQLTPVVRDEAYRIVREAARNAYQHAHAHHIETEVTFGDADLSIRIRDDGVGIDPQVLARGRRTGHWGLPGMRERSETLGGQLFVWSERNAGSEIELRIPADIAYTEPRRSAFTRLKKLFT
jgi:signal transduction histidine kinase/streptogramin lyase